MQEKKFLLKLHPRSHTTEHQDQCLARLTRNGQTFLMQTVSGPQSTILGQIKKYALYIRKYYSPLWWYLLRYFVSFLLGKTRRRSCTSKKSEECGTHLLDPLLERDVIVLDDEVFRLEEEGEAAVDDESRQPHPPPSHPHPCCGLQPRPHPLHTTRPSSSSSLRMPPFTSLSVVTSSSVHGWGQKLCGVWQVHVSTPSVAAFLSSAITQRRSRGYGTASLLCICERRKNNSGTLNGSDIM